MLGAFESEHWVDADANPAGGTSYGPGFCIGWQHGPLGQGADRKEPNGAFVETVIAAVVDRIEFYQRTQFACDDNREALEHLQQALLALRWRTNAENL